MGITCNTGYECGCKTMHVFTFISTRRMQLILLHASYFLLAFATTQTESLMADVCRDPVEETSFRMQCADDQHKLHIYDAFFAKSPMENSTTMTSCDLDKDTDCVYRPKTLLTELRGDCEGRVGCTDRRTFPILANSTDMLMITAPSESLAQHCWTHSNKIQSHIHVNYTCLQTIDPTGNHTITANPMNSKQAVSVTPIVHWRSMEYPNRIQEISGGVCQVELAAGYNLLVEPLSLTHQPGAEPYCLHMGCTQWICSTHTARHSAQRFILPPHTGDSVFFWWWPHPNLPFDHKDSPQDAIHWWWGLPGLASEVPMSENPQATTGKFWVHLSAIHASTGELATGTKHMSVTCDKDSIIMAHPQHATPKICAEIDECESNPCQHGGTCMDRLYGYTCACKPSYDGDHCENKSVTLQLNIVLMFLSLITFTLQLTC